MSQHARLGPSSAHRWLRCPASIQLSEQVPHRESGSAAAAGNLMHSVFERRMLGTGDFLAQDLLALAELDMSEVRARLIVNQGVEAAHTALANYQITEYLTECRVNPGDWVEREDFWGTADLIGANSKSKTLLVGDLKTGRGKVDVEFNDQMLSYALGALDLIDFEPEHIVLSIFQPPIFGSRPALWQTDPVTLREFQVFAARQAELTDYPNLIPNPSDEACAWCPAKTICPAHLKV